MGGNRTELIQSAVNFLRDPSIAASPLAKRIAFLEAKGLTPSEIEESIRLSNSPNQYDGRLPMYGSQQAFQQGKDWRDWFIMIVIGSGVGYLVTALARKYLFPALQPPTTTQLTEAQEALTAKYDEAAALLSQLKLETETISKDLENQTEKVDTSIEEVKMAIREFKIRDEAREEEFKSIREEVDAVRDMLPRMMDKNKEAQTASLNDLQQELRSLKSLLLSRRNESSTNPPSDTTSFGTSSNRFGQSSLTLPALGSRPAGIPAWQMPHSNSNGPSSNNLDEIAKVSTSSDPGVEINRATTVEDS